MESKKAFEHVNRRRHPSHEATRFSCRVGLRGQRLTIIRHEEPVASVVPELADWGSKKAENGEV